MRKLPLLLAAGVGYVLGTKAGRERYEQIRSQAQRFAKDPRVQRTARQAADTVKEKAPIVKDKATQAASSAADKVGSSDSPSSASSSGSPTSTDFSTTGTGYPSTSETTINPEGTAVTNPPQV
jgi:hypothetical protein